jgi:uncharacterized membrane protein
MHKNLATGSSFLCFDGKKFFSKRAKYSEIIVVLSAVAVCLLSAYILFMRDHHSLIYYGDSVSHLVIARRVFDSIHPSISLLGSVWLPATHVLLMPFVTNEFLFRTGLAGTIVSTLSTAATALLLFRIVKLQFRSTHISGTLVALIACAVFLTNPSVLYMGIVPMMEAPFMMFFMLSVYYLQRLFLSHIRNYYEDSNVSSEKSNTSIKSTISMSGQTTLLLKCSLAISAATLTRYEGWLLPFVFIFLILIMAYVRKRTALSQEKTLDTKSSDKINPLSVVILSTTILVSVSGILFWLYWNSYFTNDPLYFAAGPYSAQIQAKPFNDFLHLKPLLILSILSGVTKSMYGIPLMIASGLGVLTYIYSRRKKRLEVLGYSIMVIILALPAISNFVAMLQGSAAIYPIEGGTASWYNGRYVETYAPLIAFCSGSLVGAAIYLTKKSQEGKKSIFYQYFSRTIVILSILMIMSLSFSTLLAQPLRVGETTAMNDRYAMLPFVKRFQVALDTGNKLGDIYSDGSARIVMFAPSQVGQEIMLGSGLPLKLFINTGSGSDWQVSKNTPWVYGKYLILRTPLDAHSDPLNSVINYWTANEIKLKKHYNVVYSNPYYKIFERVVQR